MNTKSDISESATDAPLHPSPLRLALKTYVHTADIKSGALSDPRIRLDSQEIEPIHDAFAPMARTQAFDISEMAIVTYLQAKAYGKPLVMLPAVVASRFQQGCLIRRRDNPFGPGDLKGKRIGVRAYTQTTGMWIRAILSSMYGVDLRDIAWVTFKGGHLEEYRDPDFVTRAAPGKKMLEMLRDGELDAAIYGNDLPDDPTFTSVIDDPAAADRAWFAAHHYVPINHMVVMRRDVAHRDPEALSAMYDLLKKGKERRPMGADGIDWIPMGVDALRAPMAETLAFCDEQQLLPTRMTVDDVFADCLALLGDAAL